MGNGIIYEDDLHDSLKVPQYDTPQTTTSEVTRLNCLNKNLVSLVITGKTIVNLLGLAGECEDVSLWTQSNGTPSLDSTNKVVGTNGIKVTAQAAGTNSGVYRSIVPLALDANKYFGLSAYLKNGNATDIHLMKYDGAAYTTLPNTAITDSSKFNRVSHKFRGSEIQLVMIMVNCTAAGQYGYTDGIQIEEISKADYDNPNWKPSPYVSNDVSVGDTAGRIKSRGKNLINLVQGTFNLVGVPAVYPYWLIHKDGIIPVEANTTYTCSLSNALKYVVHEFNNTKYMMDTNSWSVNPVTTFTFTTGANTKFVGLGFKIDDTTVIYPQDYQIMMNEGDTALPYEPYQETVMSVMYPLRSLPSGVADTQDTKKGKVYKKVEKLILDGSLGWEFFAYYTGIKVVRANTNTPSYAIGYSAYSRLLKYNNKDLKNVPADSINASTPYAYNLYNNGYTYISIPNSDSGWGDAYTPTADEIKAYFHGWRMYIGDGQGLESIYNGSGTKCWIRMDRGGSGTTTCPTTLAPNFTPYRLYYQLSTPQEIDISVSDLIALPGGSLIMENDAQCWVRPSVSYTMCKNSRANLDGVMNQLNRASVKLNSIDLSQYVLKSQQDTWHQASLQNGWQNILPGLQYTKTNDNIVMLRYGIWGGTITDWTVIGTLPVGYRPSSVLTFPCTNFATTNNVHYPASVWIYPDGTVKILGIKTNEHIYFDGISFIAER